MKQPLSRETGFEVNSLEELAPMADYSLMDHLTPDPDATPDGVDHRPRQVFSGHYVPVRPTPIETPEYVAHSEDLFRELGFADSLAQSDDFIRMFSGDLSLVPEPMRKVGWASGYALSIYGTEYTQQCPFQTGNGYGDGRAISVLEAVINGRRWEMQLKGGGQTPYCRGADGRAVLRSSVREFLAQEHMYALGVPTSRSLSLYVSKTERVRRPWYSEGSHSRDPDQLISEPVAISTRVAPSFIRVGQLELFGRRARKQEHPRAIEELEQLVLHLIDREYSGVIDQTLATPSKVVMLAREFRGRLASLVANWIRVGYCQGNFNSDNCAAGGFTLDYGPFGFCEVFEPFFQPWTGGGQHFAFLNQPAAAEQNFKSFCSALRPLLNGHEDELAQIDEIQKGFPEVMQAEMQRMWSAKLGLKGFDVELFRELMMLMTRTPVDYTIFFRELSSIPDDIEPIKKSFYRSLDEADGADSEGLLQRWSEWLAKWKSQIGIGGAGNGSQLREELSRDMKLVNPKYTMREWFVVPAYQQAAEGGYLPLRELQKVLIQPYAEQSHGIEHRYYRLKPSELFDLGGFSHYSCSS
ncbi:protein adenylyltransferase SelO [Marinobacter sp. PE14]